MRAVGVDQWTIESSTDAERRERLLASYSGERIIEELVTAAELTAHDWEPSTECPGYQRARLLIATSNKAFDNLFNSRSGYRAQYFLSIEEGRQYNSLTIASIVDGFRSELPSSEFLRSLGDPLAKLWCENPGNPDILAELTLPARWLAYWARHSSSRSAITGPNIENPKILVMGAWQKFDPATMCSAPVKPERDAQLHASGWT